MVPNEDTFISIVEAVEAMGGELLPETHLGVPITYTIEGPHGRKVKRETTTSACGAEALIELPGRRNLRREGKKLVEIPEDEQNDQMGRFCIVCDRLDLWPIFAKAVG